MDEETRERIIDIGRAYLLRADERPGEWLGGNIWYYPARAGYRYLCLIERVDPSWLDEHATAIWARWSAVTLAFEANANERTQRLVARAYGSQPARVLGVLSVLLLLERHGGHDYPFPIFHMDSCWDAALGRFLLDFVKEHELKPRFLGELLDQLLAHKIDGAVTYTASLLPLSVPAEGPERLFAHAAAHALMAHAPQIGWPIMRRIVEQDVVFGREVFLTFPDELEHGRSRAWGKRLPVDDAADLYVWVEHNFPTDEDPHDRGPGFHAVTPRHMVAELRGTLLYELAARATPEAVAAITRIQQTLPHRDFTSALLSAREATAQGTWTPRTPREIIDLRPVAPVAPLRTPRDRLLDALCDLLPPQLEALIYKLGVPPAHLPGRDAAPAARIAELLRWAEQQGRLADVERICVEVSA